MRKDIALPALALAGGVGGFLLRRWQLARAYVPETGLFIHGDAATLALLGLTGLLILAFALLVQGGRKDPEDFLPAFGCPEAGQMTLLAAAGLLMLLSGALGLKDGLAGFQRWQADPGGYPVSNAGAQLAAAVLCLPAGLGVLLMGKAAYRRELDDWACRMAPFPALAGLVWLFATHLKHGVEPVLMKYGFGLFAVLLLTLAHYYAAAFLFGRPRPRRTAFLAMTGAAMGTVSLADRPGLFAAAATLAFSLSALALGRALLRNTFGPPWPKRLAEGRMPPSEEDDEDQDEDAPGANI